MMCFALDALHSILVLQHRKIQKENLEKLDKCILGFIHHSVCKPPKKNLMKIDLKISFHNFRDRFLKEIGSKPKLVLEKSFKIGKIAQCVHKRHLTIFVLILNCRSKMRLFGVIFQHCLLASNCKTNTRFSSLSRGSQLLVRLLLLLTPNSQTN